MAVVALDFLIANVEPDARKRLNAEDEDGKLNIEECSKILACISWVTLMILRLTVIRSHH